MTCYSSNNNRYIKSFNNSACYSNQDISCQKIRPNIILKMWKKINSSMRTVFLFSKILLIPKRRLKWPFPNIIKHINHQDFLTIWKTIFLQKHVEKISYYVIELRLTVLQKITNGIKYASNVFGKSKAVMIFLMSWELQRYTVSDLF